MRNVLLKWKYSSVVLFLLVSLLLLVVTPASAATITVSSDYNTNAGTYDPAKIMNGSQGGYSAIKNLNYLPEQYDKWSEAGLQLVRLDHIFDYYNIVSGTSGAYTNDYTNLDRIILPLLAKGITPFICVSYTPPVMGAYNSMPSNMTDWQSIVKALVQHYKDLGYTGWYWEVWNEPALFFTGTTTQYNTLYYNTVTAVRSIDSTAKVGGDGAHNWNDGFISPLASYLQANPSVPIDFFSYHEYGGAEWANADSFRGLLNSYGFGSKPIFVTEWNITATMNVGAGALSDKNANASYAAKKLFTAMNRINVDKTFFFTPTEGLNPRALFSGDIGLLTADGHRKAVFNTFKMFKNLQPTLTTTIISTVNKDTYAVVTKNTSSTKISLIIWNNSATANTFDLSLTNLPYLSAGKNIQVTGYLIDATHANYYKDFADGLKGYKIGPTESLDPIQSNIIASSSLFTKSIALGANSVTEYILEPTSAAVNAGPIIPATTIPAVNLSAGKTVATSSSLEGYSWGKANLTDQLTHSITVVNEGTASNGWTTNPSYSTAYNTESAYVDLTTSQLINQVKLYPRDDLGNEGTGFPVDFTIQGSNDAATWTTLYTATNYNNANPVSGVQTLSIMSGTYRYVKLNVTKLGRVGNVYYAQLAEMEVYNSNLASGLFGATLNASSSVDGWGWYKPNVVDGFTSSYPGQMGWSSIVGITTQHQEWVEIVFPSSVTFGTVKLYPRNDAGNVGQGFPKDFQIQVWDGVNWLTRVTQTGYSLPGNMAQVFTWTPDTSNKVRILGTNLRQLGANYIMQFAEIEVY